MKIFQEYEEEIAWSQLPYICMNTKKKKGKTRGRTNIGSG